MSFDAFSCTPLAWVGGAMFLLWLLSLQLHDASIADVFWGLGSVLVAWVSTVSNEGSTAREKLVLALVSFWGLRLSTHLLARSIGSDEDRRYQDMRQRGGNRFWIVSLFTVFGLQGLLIFGVSLPVQIAINTPVPDAIRWTDVVGAAIWLAGFGIESIADAQLTAFRSDPGNRGKVMDGGVWRYTKHPNYFGDALVWLGLGTIALSVPGHQWTYLGPVIMTLHLIRASYASPLEPQMTQKRRGYAAYAAKTSAFVPMPPRDRSKAS